MKTNKLHGKIVECGFTKADIAKRLSLSEKTFYAKMKNGNFKLNEAKQLIQLLKIDNPNDIFFDDDVTWKVAN